VQATGLHAQTFYRRGLSPAVRRLKVLVMDIWKFYDITHREHVVCNPTSEDKLARLISLLRLPAKARLVDIACGKGEFLIRLAEAYDIRGTGIDISPFCIGDARRRLQMRAPGAEVVFSQMNGSDFAPEAPRSLALASCVGASWVFGGHAGTLEALSGMVASGGWVIVGEPYWLREPSKEYLAASGVGRDDFATHAANAEAGELRGLELVHTFVSSKDDWDHYEGLQWYATAEYARSHPDDPDLPDLLERVANAKMVYLRWGRDTLGWAMYVFRHRP
jgi:SAM-dependent methyltransferase